METFVETYRDIKIYSLGFNDNFFTNTFGRLNQFRSIKQIKKFIDKKLERKTIIK